MVKTDKLHSVCNNTSKLTWQFVLVLYQAAAYPHVLDCVL